MQTHPHASLRPLSRPRVTGRGPGDDEDDNDKPMSGGVSPIFLSRISWCFKNKKRHFTENNAGGGGGGNFIMFLGKVQKQICL